jgi:hypothetical protein
LVGKPEVKRPFGRLGVGEKIILKMVLKGIGCEDMNWIHLAQNKNQWSFLLNTVMNLRVP